MKKFPVFKQTEVHDEGEEEETKIILSPLPLERGLTDADKNPNNSQHHSESYPTNRLIL